MFEVQGPLQHAAIFNMRCGDIYYMGLTNYDVCCTICGHRLPYAEFPQHFVQEHLPNSETEPNDCNIDDEPTEEQQLDTSVVVEVEPLPIKSEHDPIANDSTNESNDTVHVDLAEIALLDQDQERIKMATGMMTTRSKRRRAVLVQTDTDANGGTDPDCTNTECSDEQMEAEVSSPLEVINEDENDDDEDDARDMLFQCDQCDRAYNSKRSLQSHKRIKHLTRADDDDNTTSPRSPRVHLDRHKRTRRKEPAKIYKCAESGCNQTFRTERDLRGHRWKHTGIFCDICGKPFTQSGNMMRHRQRHSGIKPYKCQKLDCDATFYTQKELTSHNICHTGRMPCICEVCGRQCRDRGVLTAHMRRHTGERPAKCEVCGKAFYSFHDLNVHAISHTNLRPFVCDVCGSTFQRKKALRVHKLLHSEQRKYSCKLCNKSFAQSGGLNAHMRTHESARGRAKSKVAINATTTTAADEAAAAAEEIDPTGDITLGLMTPFIGQDEVLLEEAVTIELISQEEHASHMEVVTVAAAGSTWHVA